MKLTALYQAHVAARAKVEERDGWAVAVETKGTAAEIALIRSGVGMADWSFTNRVEVQGPGVATLAASGEGWKAWRLARRRALLTGDSAAIDAWVHSQPEHTIYSVNMTPVWADFLLVGPASAKVLEKLTSLNAGKLCVGDCAQASVAHVQSIVLREDRGGLPGYRVLMGRDYAESVWESFLHAGEEFGIGAVGARAIEELGR